MFFDVALMGALYALYIACFYYTKPAPSDGMFYIDAAYGIANGTYEGPTPANPYHHYLRWPAILPLALMYKVFGVGAFARSAYQLTYLWGAGVFAYVLIRRLFENRSAAFFAGLFGLFMPAGIFLPSVCSELPAAFWFLAALVSIAGRADRRHAALGGFCFALSINSNMVSMYGAVPLLLALHLLSVPRADLKTLIRRSAIAGIACMLTYAAIMGFDWLLTGSFLIQFRVLRWWVFTDVVQTPQQLIKEIFDSSSQYRFLLGFCREIIRSHPLFAIAIVAAIAIRASSKKDSRDERNRVTSSVLLILGVSGLLFWELFGAFVMFKIDRYLVIPLTLLLLWAIPEFVQLFSSRKKSVLLCTMLFGFTAAYLGQQVMRGRVPPRMAVFGSQPIDLIVANAKSRGFKPGQIEIYFENHGRPGLVYWPWQVNIYSDYWLKEAALKLAEIPDKPPKPGIASYYVGEGIFPDTLIKAGYTELSYPSQDPLGQLRPTVYYAIRSKLITEDAQVHSEKTENASLRTPVSPLVK